MFAKNFLMPCTEAQYDEFLKEEMSKMGYKEYCFSRGDVYYCFLTNNIMGVNGYVSNTGSKDLKYHNRTLIPKFNATLASALAAMTDKELGGYGEYWMCVSCDSSSFTKGKMYKTIGFYNDETPMLIDDEGDENGYSYAAFVATFRKATYEELVAELGNINTKCDIDCIPDEELIAVLKERGFRIFKEEITLKEY